MTRRSWLILLLLAVIITAAIVYVLSNSPTTTAGNPDNAAEVGSNQADSSATEGQPIEGDQTGTNSGSSPQTSSDVTGAVHFVDCAFRTGGNATIGVPLVIAQEGGFDLEPGDEIGVFTPDGKVCAGAGVWTGNNIAIAAWSDNSDTDQIEGMQEGDTFHFRIWDQSTGEEIDVTAVTYEFGDGKYTVDGIYVVNSFQ